jgi:hypothetical protein
VEAEKHPVFLGTSPSGWKNNDLGLAWIEQVFDRITKKKARGSYRILILDGHGSHVNRAFISYCHRHKILLMVFPPHSTHTLQPLDVVMFSPLSRDYSAELSRHPYCGQGLIAVNKSDFFPLFWAAYTTSFTYKNICKASKATGIVPANANVIMNRFTLTPSNGNTDSEVREHGDGDS